MIIFDTPSPHRDTFYYLGFSSIVKKSLMTPPPHGMAKAVKSFMDEPLIFMEEMKYPLNPDLCNSFLHNVPNIRLHLYVFYRHRHLLNTKTFHSHFHPVGIQSVEFRYRWMEKCIALLHSFASPSQSILHSVNLFENHTDSNHNLRSFLSTY